MVFLLLQDEEGMMRKLYLLLVFVMVLCGYSVGVLSSGQVYETSLEFSGIPIEEGDVSPHVVTEQVLSGVPNTIEVWVWIDADWPLNKYPDGDIEDKRAGIIISTWSAWEVDLSPREISNNISLSFWDRGTVRLYWNNGDLLLIAEEHDFRLGEWVHLAIVRDETVRRGVVTFYMNGQKIYEWFMGAGEAVIPNDPLVIGANYRATVGSGASNFNGKIGELRIWNSPRTQEEIQNFMEQELAGDEEGLIGYWKFDEGEGDILHDSSPYANHGTIVGAKWHIE